MSFCEDKPLENLSGPPQHLPAHYNSFTKTHSQCLVIACFLNLFELNRDLFILLINESLESGIVLALNGYSDYPLSKCRNGETFWRSDTGLWGSALVCSVNFGGSCPSHTDSGEWHRHSAEAEWKNPAVTICVCMLSFKKHTA